MDDQSIIRAIQASGGNLVAAAQIIMAAVKREAEGVPQGADQPAEKVQRRSVEDLKAEINSLKPRMRELDRQYKEQQALIREANSRYRSGILEGYNREKLREKLREEEDPIETEKARIRKEYNALDKQVADLKWQLLDLYVDDPSEIPFHPKRKEDWTEVELILIKKNYNVSPKPDAYKSLDTKYRELYNVPEGTFFWETNLSLLNLIKDGTVKDSALRFYLKDLKRTVRRVGPGFISKISDFTDNEQWLVYLETLLFSSVKPENSKFRSVSPEDLDPHRERGNYLGFHPQDLAVMLGVQIPDLQMLAGPTRNKRGAIVQPLEWYIDENENLRDPNMSWQFVMPNEDAFVMFENSFEFKHNKIFVSLKNLVFPKFNSPNQNAELFSERLASFQAESRTKFPFLAADWLTVEFMSKQLVEIVQKELNVPNRIGAKIEMRDDHFERVQLLSSVAVFEHMNEEYLSDNVDNWDEWGKRPDWLPATYFWPAPGFHTGHPFVPNPNKSLAYNAGNYPESEVEPIFADVWGPRSKRIEFRGYLMFKRFEEGGGRYKELSDQEEYLKGFLDRQLDVRTMRQLTPDASLPLKRRVMQLLMLAEFTKDRLGTWRNEYQEYDIYKTVREHIKIVDPEGKIPIIKKQTYEAWKEAIETYKSRKNKLPRNFDQWLAKHASYAMSLYSEFASSPGAQNFDEQQLLKLVVPSLLLFFGFEIGVYHARAKTFKFFREQIGSMETFRRLAGSQEQQQPDVGSAANEPDVVVDLRSGSVTEEDEIDVPEAPANVEGGEVEMADADDDEGSDTQPGDPFYVPPMTQWDSDEDVLPLERLTQSGDDDDLYVQGDPVQGEDLFGEGPVPEFEWPVQGTDVKQIIDEFEENYPSRV